jgi:hypothetical protein
LLAGFGIVFLSIPAATPVGQAAIGTNAHATLTTSTVWLVKAPVGVNGHLSLNRALHKLAN